MALSRLAIQFSVSSIDDEKLARPLLAFLQALPGFEPATYDLNRKGLWRTFNLDLAVVDLLTQRTQFFEVRGEGGTAMIATGKHGEAPTLIVEGEAAGLLDDAALDGLPLVASVKRL